MTLEDEGRIQTVSYYRKSLAEAETWVISNFENENLDNVTEMNYLMTAYRNHQLEKILHHYDIHFVCDTNDMPKGVLYCFSDKEITHVFSKEMALNLVEQYIDEKKDNYSLEGRYFLLGVFDYLQDEKVLPLDYELLYAHHPNEAWAWEVPARWVVFKEGKVVHSEYAKNTTNETFIKKWANHAFDAIEKEEAVR